MDTPKSEQKVVIPRSPRFPSISLDYAIEVVKGASKFGQSISNIHIAGTGATSGGAFNRKRASLGYYGLVEGRDGNNLHITDLAMRIINPLSDEEKMQAIQEAFLHPDLFKRLYETTQKGVPVQINILGNILIRQYSIQASGKNEFLSTFIKSGIFAHLINYCDKSKTEIRLLSQNVEAESIPKTSINEDQNKVIPNKTNTVPYDTFSSQDSQTQVVELSLDNGQAKLIVPNKLTVTDAKKLKAQINILANIFNNAE